MPYKEKSASFDYGVAGNVAPKLREIESKIDSLSEATLRAVVELGLGLIEVKAQLDEGRFHQWILSRGVEVRTAQNWMRVARWVGGRESVFVSGITPSIAYVLAAEGVPAALQDDVIGEFAAGQRPSVRRIIGRIAKARGGGRPRQKESKPKATRPIESPRDRDIQQRTARLAALTGSKLGELVQEEINIISGNARWPTLPDFWRGEIVKKLRKLASLIEAAPAPRAGMSDTETDTNTDTPAPEAGGAKPPAEAA